MLSRVWKIISIIFISITSLFLLGLGFIFFILSCGDRAGEKGNLEYGYDMGKYKIRKYYNYGSDNCDLASMEIPGADRETFKVLDDEYSKDKNNVYYFTSNDIRIVKDADPWSFELFGDHNNNKIYFYAKDKNSIYQSGERLEGSDVGTFKILNGSYSKDKNNVYQNWSIMPGADPNTFRVLNGAYSKDTDHVYYFDKVLFGADLTTFETTRDGLAKDKNYIYLGDKIVGEINQDDTINSEDKSD